MRMKRNLSLLLLLCLGIWSCCSLLSLSLGSATWDEYLDFEGALGSLWHGINTLKGLSPDLGTITFNLEWFGNASRWPTFIPWLAVQPFDFNQIRALDRVQLAILTNYFTVNHLNSILFGAAGLWLQYKLLKKYSSTRVAFIGFALLLFYPAWSGNAWMNSKDVPFAFSYLLYSYSLASIYDGNHSSLRGRIKDLKRDPAWLIRVLAIMLMVGSRFPSIVFLVLTESVILAREAFCFHRKMLRAPNRFAYKSLSQLSSVSLGLFLAFLVTPQSWANPIKYAFDCINYFSTENYYVGQTNGFFEALAGILMMFLTSTPAVVMLGIAFFILSLLFGDFGLARPSRPKPIGPVAALRHRMVLPLPFWLQLLLPIALIALKGDASFKLRHVLFCLPILCSISAIGIERVCFRRIKVFGSVSRAATAFFASILVLEFLLLNPYQYIYVGEIFRLGSGLSSAPVQLNDYWGFSVRESLSSLLRDMHGSLPERDTLLLPGGYNPQIFWAYVDLVKPVTSGTGSAIRVLPDVSVASDPSPLRDVPTLDDRYCTKRLILFPKPRQVQFGCISEK